MKAIVNFHPIDKEKDNIDITFDKDDWWQLYSVLSPVLLAAMKEFRAKNRTSYPAILSSLEEWNNILDKIILSFESITSEKNNYEPELTQEGLDLFGKYYLLFWD